MGKKIRLNKVAPTRRYRVSELAETLGISRRAIYYKIKDDLPVIIMQGTFYIVGAEFIEYEKAKREKRQKGSLKPDEFFCFHCKEKRKPLNLKVNVNDFKGSSKKVTRGTVFLTATCPVCKQKIYKITNTLNQDLNKLFNIL